ncbi:MAG: helix-turn-helix transcriptional regulator [Clostridia bacterium]|nr:helix-turn-helix transcriptional regulator [Clostridia bacterium]
MSFYEWEAEELQRFYFVQRGEYETAPHFHSAVEFHFVEDGEQEIIVDGQRKLMRRGDACFCDGFSVHQLSPLKGKSAFCLLFSAEFYAQAFSFFNGKKPPTFFRFENFALLHDLYRLCAEKRENDGARYATFGGAAQLLLGAIAENTPFVSRETQQHNSLVCSVLQYAEKHVSEDLSLTAIAKTFGYSHEHLSRILHKHLSENWNSYVNRLRVRRAEALLKNDPQLPVLTAAFACGFDSPNTFYRAYKKEFGKPPRALQNNQFLT